VNGEKAVVEITPTNNRQYKETSNRVVDFGASLGDTDIIEFIVAGSYLGEMMEGSVGTGGLTWIRVSEDVLANEFYGYLVDTTGGERTITLPEDPILGCVVGIEDTESNFETNNCIINRNGNNIMGLAQNLVLNENTQGIQLVYDGVDDWRIVWDKTLPVQSGLAWIRVSVNTVVEPYYGYFVDTTGGIRSMTLPASPEAGDMVGFEDVESNFDNNYCTIIRNGNTIMGLSENLILDEKNQGVQLVFDGINDWRIVWATPLIANTTIV
jgi:hypothetical protein